MIVVVVMVAKPEKPGFSLSADLWVVKVLQKIGIVEGWVVSVHGLGSTCDSDVRDLADQAECSSLTVQELLVVHSFDLLEEGFIVKRCPVSNFNLDGCVCVGVVVKSEN